MDSATCSRERSSDVPRERGETRDGALHLEAHLGTTASFPSRKGKRSSAAISLAGIRIPPKASRGGMRASWLSGRDRDDRRPRGERTAPLVRGKRIAAPTARGNGDSIRIGSVTLTFRSRLRRQEHDDRDRRVPGREALTVRVTVPQGKEYALTDVDRRSRNSYNPGMKSIVSEKGQVTIPKPLREKLGLRPGDVVLEFSAQRGTLVARPRLAGPENPVDAVTGILPPMDVDAEIEKMRGKAWIPPKDRPRANRR